MFTYTFAKKQTINDLLTTDWRLGKKIIHELRMAKAIMQDGTPIMWKNDYNIGDKIEIEYPTASSSYEPTRECEVAIRYEDEHCLIVSKPAGMQTHPNDEWDRDTCMNHVMAYIQQNGGTYAEHVHRLDQGTKGLLLVAKHPIAKSIFDRMIEEKTITRTYAAEVQGNLRSDNGTINAPIGRDRHSSSRRIVSDTGQRAITHYEVVNRYKGTCVVHLVLETGRTHQIRVHMQHIGHPIVGDTMYGARETESGDYELHAIQLQFEHPFLNKTIIVKDEK